MTCASLLDLMKTIRFLTACYIRLGDGLYNFRFLELSDLEGECMSQMLVSMLQFRANTIQSTKLVSTPKRYIHSIKRGQSNKLVAKP